MSETGSIGMKTILTLTAGVLLAGFAPAPTADVDSPATMTAVGWVRFSDGEFQLYDREVQVLQPFARPCLSGVASRDLMRQAVRDLGGQKVTITGTMVPWASALNHRIGFGGSNVRNACGGEMVLLADSIRPAN